jgi:hypothetical protein
MPELTLDLAAQAATYIAYRLEEGRVLPLSDPWGWQLALELARVAGLKVEENVRRQLDPLIRRAIAAGQPPPTGW